MVTKKTVKKTVMKSVPKGLTLDEQVSLAERLEESEAKLELSVRALMFARDAMKHMACCLPWQTQNHPPYSMDYWLD